MNDKPVDDRKKRLAERLRENLRRRKQHTRKRSESTPNGGAGNGPAAPDDRSGGQT